MCLAGSGTEMNRLAKPELKLLQAFPQVGKSIDDIIE